jgi:hypothetical protein
MSLRELLAKALVYLVLEIGALGGVPIRPDEVERLMKIQECGVTQVMRNEERDGKDPNADAA